MYGIALTHYPYAKRGKPKKNRKPQIQNICRENIFMTITEGRIS